ncbi:MAG: peptidoglycan DD-metalloendopeptidase family protein [Alphaproteobacteria bacterium]
MPRLRNTANDPAALHRRISKTTQRRPVTDRQFIVRSKGRIRYVRVPAVLQVFGVLAAGAFAAWVAHSSYTYIVHDEIVSAKEAAIAARDRANRALRLELADARRSFAEATDSLEQNHKGLVSLIGQNQALKGNLASLRSELARIGDEKKKTEAQKRKYQEQVDVLAGRLEATEERNQSLVSELKNTGSELADALADKSTARQNGVRMSNRVSELENRLASLREAQSNLLDRVADVSGAEIKRLKTLLASTGIKVDKLVRAQGGAAFAQGGPFEPAKQGKGDSGEEPFDIALSTAGSRLDRLEALQKVMRTLPLAAPLDYFYVSSKYGRRKDPINGSYAMHRGVDFGAKHRAVVLATAPGKVIYAGWKGKFGRFVSIDHGNGIVTRYGHLRRIYVKLGQKVDFRTKIGQMGSSGRSTGVHLHYEIHVDKRSVDPLKFMKVGKNVFKG